ncbi:type IV pilus modification protein PilV [Variovorax paradoxus]|uniref:type IV pilus modification protein PilV n=1 Tax=Variovorax paradoxus TaxID=34073 RepID=UPI003D652F10
MTTLRRSGAGFSLVEVLVSVAVLSIGLLGAVGMLLAAVRAGKEAATFNAAVGLVRDLSEKVRMNPGVSAGNGAANTYLIEHSADSAAVSPAIGGCAAPGATCDAAGLAAWDVDEWTRRVAKALPGVRVRVCFDDKPWNAAAGEFAWRCSQSGRSLVAKLGWASHADGSIGKQKGEPQRELPPRLVMQLVSGWAPNGHDGS